MAAAVKFEVFTENLAEKVHNLDTDTLKNMLTNVAPNAATHAVKADLTEISAGNGYSAGGDDIQNATSRSGGTTTVQATDIVVTAAGGPIGPFRYIGNYNDTPTSPADPLTQYWDYGASISLNDGETFTQDFGASGLMTIA